MSVHAAQAQSSVQPLSEIVVTASRAPEPLSATGSAISVVSGETLATSNPGSLVDALRSVPGLDISENGGPGGTANVRMRGGNTGQTLVMIDGIRVNDPTAASGDFEFAMFAPSAIDRIEVLRGPQSALYGSDAMGGVINIITKKGTGPAQFNVRTEAGSYGTVVTQGSLVGTNGPWSYAFTGGGQHSNGFSRYGYRIPSIEARYPNLENDGFDRVGGSARIGYDAGEGIRLEAGTVQGPLIDEKAVAKVEEHIADAVSKGAKVVVGGKRHALGKSFFEPTVVTGVTPQMVVAREETFGPLAPLFRFEKEEDAVRMANDTEFGLAAYCYTRDLGRAFRVMEGLQYGQVGINAGVITTEVAPFGGVKESGLGREGSKYGLDDYLNIKYACFGL